MRNKGNFQQIDVWYKITTFCGCIGGIWHDLHELAVENVLETVLRAILLDLNTVEAILM